MKWVGILLLSSLYFPGSALASSGDRSDDFQQCIFRCSNSKCTGNPIDKLPLSLRLTRWTCTDNCKYLCMHEITARNIDFGGSILQYYGKWPFWRLAGMQEPASVAFSLMNLWVHVKGAQNLQKALHDAHPMKMYYMVWSFVSMNTWIWSSVFHTRDTPFTEKMDYFSAALTILTGLYYTVVRLFHLYASASNSRLTNPENRPSRTKSTTTLRLRLWFATCALTFLAHISYLSLLPRFDYSYNIVFNLIIGLAHNVLWLCYSFISFRRFPGRAKTYRPRFAYKPAVLVFLMTAAMALEVLDFPPWMLVVDAHALWHLGTVPIASMWYQFLIEDASDECWKEQRLS